MSYDDDSNNWVFFDDFKVTHTPTNVIQYNEYYPFGLQTASSWTRSNNKNNFLYNEGSEMNTTTGFYDLPYRNYDAALGRFFQVDPLAHMDHSFSSYAYARNSPVMLNDPSGLTAPAGWSETQARSLYYKHSTTYSGGFENWAVDTGFGGLWGGAYAPDGPAANNIEGVYADAERVNTGQLNKLDYFAKYNSGFTLEEYMGYQAQDRKPRYKSNNQDRTDFINAITFLRHYQWSALKQQAPFPGFRYSPNFRIAGGSGESNGNGSNDLIERLNKYNDWGSSYADIPGLAFAITTKELYQDAGRAYQYYGAIKGLERANTAFKFAGAATGFASIAFAGYLAVDKYDKGTFNTSTVVDLGVSGLLVVGGLAAGTVSAPFVIAGGLIYGVARIAAGDQIDAWIDKKFNTKSYWYGK